MDTNESLELTGRGKTLFKEMYQQAARDSFIKKESKALRSTPGDAEFVTLKVAGTLELTNAMDRGWELVTTLPQGRGAGFAFHVVRKLRARLDTEAHAMVR